MSDVCKRATLAQWKRVRKIVNTQLTTNLSWQWKAVYCLTTGAVNFNFVVTSWGSYPFLWMGQTRVKMRLVNDVPLYNLYLWSFSALKSVNHRLRAADIKTNASKLDLIFRICPKFLPVIVEKEGNWAHRQRDESQ